MKKILIILLSIIFGFNSVFANTDVENFVFNKLFDEYSKCTVYYKFISRGVERKDNLNNKEKSFVDEMNKLSSESEKNMFFFSKKMNISSENVQKNIQKIYKSFLDIAGHDYSKTEILNSEYLESCKKSLEDPQARMVYWDIQFQKNGDKTSEESEEVANSLLGIKLGDSTYNYKTFKYIGHYDSKIVSDKYLYTKNTNKFFDNYAYVKTDMKGTILFISIGGWKTKTPFKIEKECEDLVNKISNIKANQFINNGYKKTYTQAYPRIKDEPESVEKWRNENNTDEILNDGRWDPVGKRWTMIDINFEKFNNSELKKRISYRAHCSGPKTFSPSIRISNDLELISLFKLYDKEQLEKKLKEEKEKTEQKLEKEKQLEKDAKEGFE